MPWLLDTNILSELRRPRPERRVLEFVEACALEQLYVSTVTLAEIRYGIEGVTEPDQRAELAHWLHETVRPMFAHRVLEISEDVMLRWRVLVDQGRKSGHTFSQPDLIIAATALEYDMTLVTRNVRDFSGLSLMIFNPWDA
jgi:predicted nucleic acid-binding protein